MLQVKLKYYYAYMSVFKGRKFEISVIIAYFDIFQLKPIIKPDNIHNFTEFPYFLYSKRESAQANIKFVTLSHSLHNSHISHTQLPIVLALYVLIPHQC